MSIDIGSKLAQLERRLAAVEHASRLSSASIDDTSIEVRDGTGGLRALVGQQADGTTAVNVVNGPTPPTPSAPTVEPALAALAVTWDGTFSDALAAPLDWMRCEVHVGPVSGFTPDQGTLRDTIETTQGGTVTIPLPYTEWHIKLRSRTSAGVAGPATAAVSETPRKAEAADITAGAITADAIAVDALTGKTITGGTITGALIQTDTTGQRVTINEASANKIIVYDATGRAVGELSDAGVLLEGENGALIHLDPDGLYPNLRLTNDDKSNEAVINVVENTPGSANLGLNCGTFTANGFTDMKWRTFFGEDFYAAERFRESDSATVIGGRVYMDGSGAHLQFLNSATPSQNSGLDVAANIAQMNSRLEVLPPNASALSVLFANAASGHTGNMMRLQKNLVDQCVVDNSGNLTVAGHVTAGASNVTAYAPTVAGGGTVTWTTRTGWYTKLGRWTLWNAYLVVNAAGSGAASVTITSPTNPSRTTKQVLTVSAEGVKVNGLHATGYIASLTTGTGNVWDRMSTQDNGATNRLTVILGSHLLAGSQITVQGLYLDE